MSATTEGIAITYAADAFTSPTVPLSCAVPAKKVDFGSMIMIDGFTLQKGNRFNISLDYVSDDNKINDTVLHLAVRFDEKCVVRNSRVKNEWGQPDRFGGLAGLKQGSPFECYILVKEDCFKIAFSKKHLADYKHRSPPGYINMMRIDGAVQINSISFQSCPLVPTKVPSQGMPPLPPPSEAGTENKDVVLKRMNEPIAVYGPKMPVAYHIPGNMKPGRVVYVSGKIDRYSKGFQINFKVGSATGHGDTAFHFRVHRNMKAVWCNANLSGRWGKEDPRMVEMGEHFPFKIGTHFDWICVCEAEKYKVSVNNRHLLEFKHRVPDLKSIGGVAITGDLTITQLRIA